MSEQIQIHKCPTRGCNNNSYKNLPPTSRKLQRFCFQCMKRYGMGAQLTWTCIECNLPISPNNIQIRLCDSCGENHFRNYHKKYWQTVRRFKAKPRYCRNCSARISVGRSSFCTDYCKWINYLKNWNPKIKKQLELVR